MGFYQVCLELKQSLSVSHSWIHLLFTPSCLPQHMLGVLGPVGVQRLEVEINFGKATDLLPRFFLHIPGFGKLKLCSHHPKKKHSTVAGGLRRTTFLLRLPKFSVSGPHEILGASAFQPFLCLHRSALGHPVVPQISDTACP